MCIRDRLSIGDLVLIRTNPISDLTDKITAKFCELYESPYKIKDVKGGATYVVAEVDNLDSVRGIFNISQMKPYYYGWFIVLIGNFKIKNIKIP